MNKAVLQSIIDDLKAGRTPQLSSEDFSCFSAEALAGNNHVAPDYLDVIAKSLTEADIPTFERAIRAVDEGDLAWLGFKVIYDAAEAQRNTDNEVTKKYGDQGSADGEPLVFFCNDAKEIVSSRTPSPRDTFQMKDVTRGPSMHNEQFEGLTWRSVALFDQVHVWLLGASDVASELSALATHVGFKVTVVDYDLPTSPRSASPTPRASSFRATTSTALTSTMPSLPITSACSRAGTCSIPSHACGRFATTCITWA